MYDGFFPKTQAESGGTDTAPTEESGAQIEASGCCGTAAHEMLKLIKKCSLLLVNVVVTVDTLIAEELNVSVVTLPGPVLVQQVVQGLYVIRQSIAANPTQVRVQFHLLFSVNLFLKTAGRAKHA